MANTQQATLAGSDAMEARKQRGAILAQRLRITQKAPHMFLVPASSGPGAYVVETDGTGTCTCVDHQTTQLRCKHQWAVEFSRRSETMEDGSTKTVSTMRITYSQQWSQYNAAQCHEKEHVVKLLRSLCDGVADVQQEGAGRRRLPMGDRVFAVAMKVYGGMSTRRTDTDMRDYATAGHLSRAPSYNSVIDYMDDAAMTPILSGLIAESAAPMASVERTFAVDSSGFSTSNYVRWVDEKYGKERSDHEWLKAHIAVGVKTNVICAAKVTESAANDSPQLPELMATTAKMFHVDTVLADKGYLSHANALTVEAMGADMFVPFKTNSTGARPRREEASALWRKMFHFFQYNRADFMKSYGARSNVESTFSSVKRKFGAGLRSKGRVAQENELLAKLLCFNLSMLVHEIYELGIVPAFWVAD